MRHFNSVARKLSTEEIEGVPVAAYREHIPVPEAHRAVLNTPVLHRFSEHWSTPNEAEFPVRLFTEDDVRGIVEKLNDTIAELTDQVKQLRDQVAMIAKRTK